MGNDAASDSAVLYQEKLWPAWWLWLVGIIIGGSLSITFFPIGAVWGFMALIIGVALCVIALVFTTPRIEITESWLRVGRASIERQFVGVVTGHRGDAAREQLGIGFDATSYQCIRGTINPVITAQVTDPQDPTPYWLFSSRHPEKVVNALGSNEVIRTQGAL